MSRSQDYDLCEMGVQKRLASMTDIFKEGSVTRGDFSPLDRGVARLCVLTPGTFTSERKGAMKIIRWIVVADAFQKFTKQAETFANFIQMRSASINELESHPTLHLDGDVQVPGVFDVVVLSGGEPGFIEKEGTNVSTHLVQTWSVQVSQMIELTGGEY